MSHQTDITLLEMASESLQRAANQLAAVDLSVLSVRDRRMVKQVRTIKARVRIVRRKLMKENERRF